MAHILYQRDYAVPSTLNLLRRREVLLQNYSERSAENARRAEDDSIQHTETAARRIWGYSPGCKIRRSSRKSAMRKRNCAMQ